MYISIASSYRQRLASINENKINIKTTFVGRDRCQYGAHSNLSWICKVSTSAQPSGERTCSDMIPSGWYINASVSQPTDTKTGYVYVHWLVRFFFSDNKRPCPAGGAMLRWMNSWLNLRHVNISLWRHVGKTSDNSTTCVWINCRRALEGHCKCCKCCCSCIYHLPKCLLKVSWVTIKGTYVATMNETVEGNVARPISLQPNLKARACIPKTHPYYFYKRSTYPFRHDWSCIC